MTIRSAPTEVVAPARPVLHFLDASLALAIGAFVWLAIKPAKLPLVALVTFAVMAALVAWFGWTHAGARRVSWRLLVWGAVFVLASHLALAGQEGMWHGFRIDPDLGWVPLANLRGEPLTGPSGTYRATTDARGFRNVHPYPADGRLPVVLQGDSNAFGFGLAETETFCALWAQRSAEPCFNWGVPGYDANHYFLQFERMRREFRIGTRIILFNIGNDFSLSALETPYLLPRPYLYLEGTRPVIVWPFATPFHRQVYGHHFIKPYASYDRYLETVAVGRDWGRRVPGWLAGLRLPTFLVEKGHLHLARLRYAVFDPAGLIEGRKLNPYYPPWQLTRAEEWPEPYRDYRRHFTALLAAVAKQPAERTILVLVPMREQVVPEQRAAVLAQVGSAGPDPLAVNRYVAGTAGAARMRVIDVTAAFAAASDVKALFQRDQHASVRGMSLIVDEVIRAR